MIVCHMIKFKYHFLGSTSTFNKLRHNINLHGFDKYAVALQNMFILTLAILYFTIPGIVSEIYINANICYLIAQRHSRNIMFLSLCKLFRDINLFITILLFRPAENYIKALRRGRDLEAS